MVKLTKNIEQVMDSILRNVDGIKKDWDKIKIKYNKAGARRIRRFLDDISKKKVELRKLMLEAEQR